VEISTLVIRPQISHHSSPATITPLLHWLSTKHNLIDLAKKAVSCKRIKEHKQQGINTQYEIVNMNDMNIKTGFKNSVPNE